MRELELKSKDVKKYLLVLMLNRKQWDESICQPISKANEKVRTINRSSECGFPLDIDRI